MRNLQRIGGLTILLGALAFPCALCAAQVQVAVNGQYVSFPDQSPYVDAQSGRLMVPARFVAEKLGLRVQWKEQTGQVALENEQKTVLFTIGQSRVQVNGEAVTLDAPAAIQNGRAMVPLRFASEAFDAQIDWLAERQLALVTTPGHSSTPPPPLSPANQDNASPLQQGTWIWDAALIQTEPDRILAFAEDHRLTAIYLQIDKGIPEAAYQSFVRQAKAKQIKVEALAGRPEWAFANYQGQIRDLISWVKAYNAAVGSEASFAGLHFDIEPYLLPEWKTANRRVIANWLDNLRLIERETKGSGLTVAMDVPFWLHLVKVPDTDYSLSAWILEKVDSVVIMDYRNSALGNDGIVANANTILREAATLQKQGIVAVETSASSEGPQTTFYSLRAEAMNAELQIAREQLSHFSSYAGFAIHDYTSWQELEAKSQ